MLSSYTVFVPVLLCSVAYTRVSLFGLAFHVAIKEAMSLAFPSSSCMLLRGWMGDSTICY